MLKRFVLSAATCAALIVGSLRVTSQTPKALAASTSHVRQIPATPPPMGWSSWNSFSNTVNSDVVVRQTNAIISSGMKNAGYQYVNIDEGWWLGQRDRNDNEMAQCKAVGLL